MARDKAHIVAMTGSYFRGDAAAVLHPDDEAKFKTVTYTYYEQLNGYHVSQATGHRLLLLCRQLHRRNSEGAQPGGEDDPAYSQREFPGEHERQDSRGGRTSSRNWAIGKVSIRRPAFNL